MIIITIIEIIIIRPLEKHNIKGNYVDVMFGRMAYLTKKKNSLRHT